MIWKLGTDLFNLQKTHAHRKLSDDVPPEIKQKRMSEMSHLARKISAEINKEVEGTLQLVLVEGVSFTIIFLNSKSTFYFLIAGQ